LKKRLIIVCLAIVVLWGCDNTGVGGSADPFLGSWTLSTTGATWTFSSGGNLAISSSSVPLTYMVSGGDKLTITYTDGSGTYSYTYQAVSNNLIRLFYGVIEMDLTR
jgi:hypothetical protein